MADLSRILNHREADRFADILEIYFPWLDTDDEASGSDSVDALIELYDDLKKRIASKS